MADDLFDSLVKLRDAAKVANANAQQIIRNYRRKPDFSYAANSGFPHVARAQERAAARNHLLWQHTAMKYIDNAVVRFREAGLDIAGLVTRSVALKVPPIFVGDDSYPTAHEAAIALGEAVLEAWEQAGGYDAVERAPDRLQAEADGDDADIAIEVSLDLWKRLRRLCRKNLPDDLSGQIRQEFEAATELLEAESRGSDDPQAANRAGNALLSSDQFTVDVFAQRAGDSFECSREQADRNLGRTLVSQLTAAAATGGLCQWTADRWAIGNAVRAWLVSRGMTDQAAENMPVAAVVSLLAERGDVHDPAADDPSRLGSARATTGGEELCRVEGEASARAAADCGPTRSMAQDSPQRAVAVGANDKTGQGDGSGEKERRFRVALSFPGEHRKFLAEVADSLARGLGQDRVFYDKYYEAELARPDLDTYLQKIYHDDSDLIAVFLCAEYEKKDWCGLECRAIRDLIKKRNSTAIMLFQFDSTSVPGLFSIDGYAEIGPRSPSDVALLILQRLEHNDQQVRSRFGTSGAGAG